MSAVTRARRRTGRLGWLVLAAACAGLLAALLRPTDPQRPPIDALRVSSDTGIATGFAIANGRAVTVAHGVDGARTLAVRTGTRTFAARVLRIDRRSDLALLSVPGLRPRRFDTASATSGDRLRLARVRDGRTSVQTVHVRRAISARLHARRAEYPVRRPALELDAGVMPGDSGAPLVTDAGALAGVIFAASRSRAGTAYAVDAVALRRLLRR